MLFRAAVSGIFLTALVLLLASCGDGQPAPARTAMPPASPTAASVTAPTPIPTPVPTPTYLAEEIPPCTPLPGSSVDPCQPRARRTDAANTGAGSRGPVPLHVKDLLAIPTLPFYNNHIVLRGTYLPGTVRCTSGHRVLDPFYAIYEYGGLIIYCFADVRVNAYLIGSGPPTLTVIVASSLYISIHGSGDDDEDYGLPQLESRRLAYERALAEGGRFQYDEPLEGHLLPGGRWRPLSVGYRPGRPWVSGPPGGIGAKEVVLFIRPSNNISVEAWRVTDTWDLERREDGTVVAIHPYIEWFDLEMHRPLLEMELPALEQAVTAAHQARVAANGGRIGADESLPMLVTDANRLRQYFADPRVGGYAPGVPTPTQPPPPCGLAVPDQANNPGLMRDCITLLELEDTLAGTAALDWTVTSTISTWEGIGLNASSTRVTALELDAEDLDGVIPPGLGGLSALVTLDLSDNDLTGEIPEELGRLSNLEVLRLSGNSLTGCIPLALMSVATNDLGSLDLLYCVPAPGGLSAGTPGETSVPLGWDAAPNAARYRVEYRTATATEWTVDTDDATSTSHTVDDLACDTGYLFRVSARGSGTVYTAEWSDPSEAVAGMTSECRTPAFSASSYTFTVREDIDVGRRVGTVSATDPDGGAVTYTITAGNSTGKFAIGQSSGEITVAGALDYETAPAHTLTVEASDDKDGVATTTVEIAVSDVPEDTPPAPVGLSVSLTDDTFGVTWTAVTGASFYEVQQQVSGSGVGWAMLATTTGLSSTYSPVGGTECGTTYEFRVRAYGDGTTYVADWGQPSEPEPYTTEACNRAPTFQPSSHTLTIPENAGTSTSVGTISATDPDGDTVTYSITAGNDDGKFAIATTTGAITVAGALDHETAPSYTLTVEASDGRGGAATATVRIAVTDVPEEAPPAPGGLGVTLADDTFAVTWSAVAGAAFYEVQQQASGSGAGWALFATTTGESATYSPAGGAECGTTYEFRVRSSGDGATYVADWGEPSQSEPYTTDVCNRAPRFGASSYTFTIPESAGTSTSVGTVSATDPDDDTVSYSITAGNDDGKFAIATSTGAITLTGTVDPDLVAFYALTVAAGDGVAGTSTAAVGVAVLLNECSNGTVVPRPRSNPRLVRDCSMLLAARDTLAGAASLDWNADTDINDWQGLRVERGDSPYVRVLLLTGMGLTGRIPPEIGGIADLRRLDLDDNMLTGQIPRELGSLSDLELMYLHINRLTGAIPAELGALANLQTLNLSDNMLTGGIPAELGKLRNLRELLIEVNSLTGGIPAELGKLSNLTHLLLERNSLGGEIPPQLGDLTRLKAVYLRHNGLTGAIPAAWGELANLTYLYLSSGNSFTGCIPSGLRDVADNDLAGLGLDYCGSSEQ